MFPNFAVPPIWIPSGTHQRRNDLSAVRSITFGQGIQGMYIQALSQNVRITIDGTTPSATGNDTGFVLRSTDAPVLITGQPGQVVKVIQEAATAVLQYQMLTLGGRYGN